MNNLKIPPQDTTKIFAKVFGDVDPKHALPKISKAERRKAPKEQYSEQKFLDFVAKNNLKSFHGDEQRDIYKKYQQIIEKLRKHGNKYGVQIGNLAMHEIRALGIALKEFAPTYQGNMLIKTETEDNHANYVRVNPETVDV